MYTDISLYAYDCLDHIMVTVTCRQQYSAEQARSEPTFRVSTTVDSSGEADAREWARDALIAALESL